MKLKKRSQWGHDFLRHSKDWQPRDGGAMRDAWARTGGHASKIRWQWKKCSFRFDSGTRLRRFADSIAASDSRISLKASCLAPILLSSSSFIRRSPSSRPYSSQIARRSDPSESTTPLLNCPSRINRISGSFASAHRSIADSTSASAFSHTPLPS